MRKKSPWLELVMISLAIVALLFYLGFSVKQKQQTLPVNSWQDEVLPIETNSVPSFEEIIKKDNPQNGPTQDQMRQLLKSIVDKELPDLTIVKPDIDTLLEKSNQNNATAQYDLGKIYFNGSWLPINEPLALNLILKSAKQGNTDAMRWLYSYIIEKLILIEKFRSFLYEKKELPKGMNEKLQNALQLLATYNEKAFVPKYRDSSKGDLLDRNTDKKQPDYIDRLDSNRRQANLQSYPVAEGNKAKVVTETQHDTLWDRAKKGDIDALYSLGDNFSVYYYFPETFAFVVRAAQLGHIEAQYKCGDIHWHSGFSMYDVIFKQKISAEQHLNEAKKWYAQAATNGHSEAQFQLAKIELESGNCESALKWYTEAAESGHDESIEEIISMMNKHENMKTFCLEALSMVVFKQKGFDSSTLHRVAWELAITKNKEYCKQAVEVYEKLAENGDYSSCKYLGHIYSQKKGFLCEGYIEKNIEKAIYCTTVPL
jgi:TPR repeat protein